MASGWLAKRQTGKGAGDGRDGDGIGQAAARVWAAERTNIPREVCEAALAHSVMDKAEAAYQRSDLFERRRNLMNRWAAFVTTKPGDVVSIAPGRAVS